MPQPAPASLLPTVLLLSPSQVAAVFGRSLRTIRAWVSAGHLRPVRVGAAVFFREDAIMALLDTGLPRSVPEGVGEAAASHS